jgi:hypothetical protein
MKHSGILYTQEDENQATTSHLSLVTRHFFLRMKKNSLVLIGLMLLFSLNLAAGEKINMGKDLETMYPQRFTNSFSTPTPIPTDEGDGGDITPGGRPDPRTALNPIGDAFWLVSLFGIAYGVSLFKRRTRERVNK